jgi:type II secretory pathway component PulJ
MRFASRPINGTSPARSRAQAGFTLAEVLAALLFMAIVIPVAIEGLHVASLAGEVAERKLLAARVAERILYESMVATNLTQALQNGTVTEGMLPFRWTLRTEPWNQDASQMAPRYLSVEVAFPVREREYLVTLGTLVNNAR